MYSFLAQGERFLGLDDAQAAIEQAGVIILPLPFEKTSSYTKGSFAGPAAILAASQQVELFDAHLGEEPWRRAGGIATCAPINVEDCPEGQEVMERLQEQVAFWLKKGKKLITLTGEHTGVLGAIFAHTRQDPDLTILHLDAHADLRDHYEGSPFNHACTARRVHEAHQNMVQVGVRSLCTEENAYITAHQIPVFYAEDLHQKEAQGQDWIAQIIAASGPRVYVSLDCDVLDPSQMPATGTPEPGGLSWLQLSRLLERLSKERELVGMDVSELAPIPYLKHPEFSMAKLIYRVIAFLYQ